MDMFRITTTRENNQDTIKDILSSSIYNIGDKLEVTFFDNSKIIVFKDKHYNIEEF